MTGPKDATITPPYPPWPTFKGFFTTLKNTAIPQRIDSSVMSKMSGSAQQQVRAALTFFGLVGETGTVQPALRDLVDSIDNEIEWKDAWTGVFFDHYDLVTGDLEIGTATLKQLADRFRERGGVSGSVLRKALRFYLDGLSATGAAFSPHFKARGLGAIAGDRKPVANRNGKNGAKGSPDTPQSAGKPTGERGGGIGRTLAEVGLDDFVIKLPGRDPVIIPLPHGLTDGEWQYISDQVAGYMKLRKGK
jgi:hypothetical protein